MITGKREKNLVPKADFIAERKAGVRFNQLSHEEQDELIKKRSEIRQYHMQMRADFRRGNLRRDEKPGSAEVRGRHQTPDQSRDGKMPGRFLPDQSNRTFGKRVWNGLDRDSFKRRGFTDSPEEK